MGSGSGHFGQSYTKKYPQVGSTIALLAEFIQAGVLCR